MNRKRSGGPAPGHGAPGMYPWALVAVACAVCVPLFRSGVALLNSDFGWLEPWLHPSGSRAVNVLIHALTSVVMYQLGRRILGGTTAALWAALFFAVHPVHVDAIAQPAGSAELITASCLLGAVLFSLGVFRAGDGRVIRGVSLLSAALLWLALRGTAWYQPAQQHCPGNPLLAESAWTRFVTGISVLGGYLKLLILPYRLSPDYSYDSVAAVNPTSAAFVVPALCILALLVFAVVRAWQGQGFYLLAGAFLLICSFPVWGLGKPLMLERWLYFPSAVFCWMLTLLLRDSGLLPRLNWRDRRFVKSAALLVVVLVLPWSIKTYFRSRQWRDEKVLLQQSALAVPRNVEIQLLLGDHHTREADYRSAQAYYRRASEISADCTEAGLRLASSYRQTGMYEEALASTRRLSPSAPKEKALRATEIARIFVAMENYSPAARSFEDSLGHFEMDAVVHRELGMLYLHMLGEPDRGRRHLRRSLELDSSQPAASAIRELLARP